jgi:hypothetical protein
MAQFDTLVMLPALAAELPAADYATFDIRADVPIVVFPKGGLPTAEFGFILPQAGGAAQTPGLKVVIAWAATSATSGNVKWSVGFKSFSQDIDDIDGKAYATAKTITADACDAAGEVRYSEVTFSNAEADNLARGEYAKLRLQRDQSSDTMLGSAEVLALEIREN